MEKYFNMIGISILLIKELIYSQQDFYVKKILLKIF